MHARVARYRIEPERCEDAVASFREAAGELSQLDGFRNGYVMIDSENGEVVTVTLWESRAALDASDVRAASIRQRAVQGVEGSVESVGRYDVSFEIGS